MRLLLYCDSLRSKLPFQELRGTRLIVLKGQPPALTCEAVLTEAIYFLREDRVDVDPLFKLIERKALSLDFDLSMHWPRVRALMKRWTQMDLADASIVLMSELHTKAQVL